MNEENGKRVLIGGGLVLLGALILNQIYSSGFEAGLVAGGGDPGAIARYGHGGFPFGFFLLIGIGAFIWWKVTNGGKRGPGGFFRGRHGMFDDRRQSSWPQPYQHQHFGHAPSGQQAGQQYSQPSGQQYGAPQQPTSPQAPGAAPQPPVNYGAQGAPQQPPADYSPPTSPAPGHPQPEPGQPPVAGDQSKL